MNRFRFWIILFVIGMGCLFVLENEFELGVALFLVACLLAATL